jgi:hypothetical protein
MKFSKLCDCFRKAKFVNISEQQAKGVDEEVEEDWKKVSPNPETQFKDFVNCDDDVLTRAKVITEEICSAADKTKLQRVKKKSMRNHHFLHLGRQFPGNVLLQT